MKKRAVLVPHETDEETQKEHDEMEIESDIENCEASVSEYDADTEGLLSHDSKERHEIVIMIDDDDKYKKKTKSFSKYLFYRGYCSSVVNCVVVLSILFLSYSSIVFMNDMIIHLSEIKFDKIIGKGEIGDTMDFLKRTQEYFQ